MKRLITPLAALFALLLTGSLSSAHAQSAKARPDFVPGELVVGYKSEQDRNNALKDIGNLKGAGGGVQAEEFGDKGLILSFDFSGITKAPNENPRTDLSLLEEMAKSLRESDKTVVYAHPNWIMDIDPPHTNEGLIEPQSFPEGPQKQSGAGTLPEDPRIKNAQKPANEPQSFSEVPQEQLRPAALPNDPLFNLQWNYLPPPTGVNAIEAWRTIEAGRPVKTDVAFGKQIVIAVLDTGIIYDHEDISGTGRLAQGYNFVSRNLCTGEPMQRGPDATDTGNECPIYNTRSNWHGTHVAGIVGAIGNNTRGIAGMTWNIGATILPVRVLGPNGGSVTDNADAIRWAAGLKVKGVPANATPANVINMSFSGRRPCDEEHMGGLISAILQAREAGAVIVASAGNGVWLNDHGKTCPPGSPNCKQVQEDFHKYEPVGCPGVISVAASDPYGRLAYYSNYGTATIMAPGGDMRRTLQYQLGKQKKTLPLGVWSCVKGAYEPKQGTSQAAPHVSGAIALALSMHPDWVGKPDLVERKLRATSRKALPDAYPQETPVGAGQLDAEALIADRTQAETRK